MVENNDSTRLRGTGLLKNRYGRFPVIRFFLFLSTVCLIGYYCSRVTLTSRAVTSEQPPPASAPAETDLPPPEPQPRPEPTVSSYVVKSGDTFAGMLTAFGVQEAQAISFYRTLRDLGLTALFPGDSLVVTQTTDGGVDRFSLLNRLENWYHLNRTQKAFEASRVPVAYSHYRCCVKGVLENSLSADMYRLGVGDALVCKLADIFAWDINFFTDPRKGDTFEVLFEKLYAEGRFVGYGEILGAHYRTSRGDFYAIGMRDSDGTLQYYDLSGKSVQKKFLKAPLRFRRISSGYTYNRRHPILGIVRAHLGIDYAAPRGTPVHAAADGLVRFAGRKGGYGNHVRISHGAAYTTYYGHLHRISRGIRRGARVKQGQMIGTVGSTGLSTGPHLDYRMKRNGRFVNPLKISVPSKEGVSKEELPRFEQIREECLLTFDKRFPSRHGYWVLNIDYPSSDSTTTRTLAIAKADGDGAGSGS